MAVENRASGFIQQEVGVVIEPSRGRNRGFQHPEGPCCGITRIGKTWQTLRIPLRIQPFEGLPGHDDLAADLKRPVSCNPEGQGTDSAGIFCDIFADGAIAARDCLLQRVLPVAGGE